MHITALHDLSRFPVEPGMIIFPISMSRIQNAQNPEKCFEFLELFWNKIKKTEGIGLIFLYTDYLYMYSDESAQLLRDRYYSRMSAHKHGFQNILEKNPQYIKTAFTYMPWGQALINCAPFTSMFGKLKKIFASDPLLQACVAYDGRVESVKELTENQINFFLEESLVLSLLSKGQIVLPNEYVQHRERWVLSCYPGKPIMTETFLYQKNPFKLFNTENRFENSYYDLEEKKLYDFLKIPLEDLLVHRFQLEQTGH